MHMVPVFIRSTGIIINKELTKAGPKTSRKEPPDSAMARGTVVVVSQPRGGGPILFCLEVSQKTVSPFISALEVLRIRTSVALIRDVTPGPVGPEEAN
jgi:hypothetical protein